MATIESVDIAIFFCLDQLFSDKYNAIYELEK